MTYSLVNLFYDAQGGDAMANLARHFNMPIDNVERVVEALLPAFSIGLKHNTANPLSLAGFLSTLATGRHHRFYTDPFAAFSPTRRHEEDAILGHLLGSKDVSRAVADQVEATTGVATAVVREMLPAVAAILMGGLAHEAPQNALTAPAAAFIEGFARGRPEPKPDPAAHGMLDAMSAFLQGFGRGRDDPPEEEAGNDDPETPPSSGTELFGDLFEAGIDIQQQHLGAIQDIFHRFYGEDVEPDDD